MKVLLLIILTIVNISYGLIFHPNYEPGDTWTDRPIDSVTAKVGSCSGIVIHPNYVLSAKHCSFSLSTPIRINGSIYYAEKYYDQYYFDLRIIKINHYFDDFLPIPEFDIVKEYSVSGENIYSVLGGYGKIRGNTIYASYDINTVVGYQWGSHYGDLRWGTNSIYGYNKAFVYTKFNEPGNTPYECGLATYDSGCGLFVKNEGRWWTVGVGKGVGELGYSFFKDPDDQNKEYATKNSLTNTYSHEGWINSILYGADMNNDGNIDLIDLILFTEDWLVFENTDYPNIPNYYKLYNSRSDLNQDGVVNMLDFFIFSKEWVH